MILHAKTAAAALLVALACAGTASAAADTPMTGAEFQSYAEGKTLVFRSGGQPYGAEEYLSNQRVRWAFMEDDCMEGRWYQSGEEICFEYEGEVGAQCWRFYKSGSGLRAIFSGNSGTELFEASQSDQPLLCLGPDVGA